MKSLLAATKSILAAYGDKAEIVRDRVHAIYATALPDWKIALPASTNYYHFYPFLFRDAFPSIGEEDLLTVATAGVLYLDHICLLDDLVDEGLEKQRVIDPFLSALLHEEAILRMTHLLPPGSGFWKDLQDYHREFATAMIRELRRRRGVPRPYTREDYFTLSKGKSALSKATTSALGHLADAPSVITSLGESQDYFNAALQAYDDVKDWERDFADGKLTFVITEALRPLCGDSPWSRDALPSSQEVRNELYYGGHIEHTLSLASEWSRRAEEEAAPYGLKSWSQLTRLLDEQVSRLSKDLGRVRTRTVLRSQGYLTESREAMLGKAVEALLEEQAKGYREATHAMDFGTTPGKAKGALHRDCVFQRALVADTLLDVLASGRDWVTPVVEAECNLLAAQRLQDVRGGWSYFPSLEDLPPDADDLGQILQVFVRAGYTQTPALVDDSLELLLSSCRNQDGSFETWIVDPAADDLRSAKFREAVRTSWGSGPDVEVIANLAYGLYLYDPAKYRQTIAEACRYLVTQQHEDGFWQPTWYATNFYGTYVVVRLLACVGGYEQEVQRAHRWLMNARRDDGGFGTTFSTPLETALTLLTLPTGASLFPEMSAVRKAASRFLELTEDNGTWSPSDFILMDSNRASRHLATYRPRILTYKSRTITSSFVLKAMLSQTLAEEAA